MKDQSASELNGASLSHYRITAKLGAGGMGEVYRATDENLGRDVAIKVLPAEVAEDPERLARFRREAQLLGSLNHTNIASLFGLEEADGKPFLVLELVEGAELSERLRRGPLPVEEAIDVAKQIAGALEEAHEHGIVHRDLKPANIKLTPGGRVKVLDFGLARAYAGDAAGGSAPDASQSPTMSAQATQAGVVLGTAAYMSPEQARGKPVDKRADIWAFGVVLYEMLTGTRLFTGETVSDVLAAVLTREPDWDRLPSRIPGGAHASLRRCLERDPRRRLRDIGDVRLEGEPMPAPRSRARSHWPALALAGLACAALGGFATLALGLRSHSRPELTRLSVLLPEDRPYLVDNWPTRALAIAPDGSKLVYVAEDAEAENGRRLYERSLDDLDVRPVPGTEGGHAPFYSPDGRWLAFFTTAESALRKVSLSGGPAITLTRGVTGPAWTNGSWSEDGSLAFYDWGKGLRVLSDGGDELRRLASPEGEVYLHPQALEGTDLLLYTVQADDGYRIEAAAPRGDRRHTVVEGGSHGLALASGHLLFRRDGVLYVAPLDAPRARVTGRPVPLPLRVKVDNPNQEEPRPQLAVSRNGTLAYVPTSGALDRECALTWVEPAGGVETLGTLAAGTPSLRLSPDGTRLAITSRVGSVVRYEILRLQSMTTTLVADVKAQLPGHPVWHPDGRHVVVTTSRLESSELWLYDAEGDGSPVRLGELPGTEVQAHSFSPDGRYLVGNAVARETGVDVWVLDLEAPGGEGEALRSFVATPAEEWSPSFSPDGRFVAYTSDESGRYEVHVRRFPGGDGRVRVSADGGAQPRWSPRGDEIYFWSLQTRHLLSHRFDAVRGVGLGESRVVYEEPSFTGFAYGSPFDIAPDGRILVRTLPEDPNRAREIVVVQNWFEEVRRLTGTP